MSINPIIATTGLVNTAIVGGLGLATIGLFGKIYSDTFSGGNQKRNRRTKGSSIMDQDLMFGHGEHMKKGLPKRHKSMMDYGYDFGGY